ncbi:hypothetical protein LTSEALA_0229 [Salmonella enterica subsp. enterica serovar Alachua str. R6-377]|uniref:Uncharacterized protein n=1 Tax=Salmonella enterica subsp. enterica serovar Alachua str. R6-377 TaxID=913241 RepID=G5LIZ1_SALET|nr:hypothetical protein LTSEALA_0229 [Salmonella enterica subsp. enterica serovar Alachua str. R6-377]
MRRIVFLYNAMAFAPVTIEAGHGLGIGTFRRQKLPPVIAQ